MANYSVHVGGGIIGSTLFTATSYFTGLLDFYAVPILFGAGVLGSIFPDVDSDHSTPIRIIFRILTLLIVLGFLYLFKIDKTLFEYGLLLTIVVIALIYLAINHSLKLIFKRLTVHRGIFHSILAIVVIQGILVIILNKVYNVSPIISCFAGVSFAFGYLIHLILDEVYSVDFNNNTLKNSHGTALKLADFSGIPGLGATMLFLAIGVFLVMPNIPNPIIADINPKGFAVLATDKKTKKLKFYEFKTPGLLLKSVRLLPKDGKLDSTMVLLKKWKNSTLKYIGVK